MRWGWRISDMERKVVFHEFDPVVYPRKVWVARRALTESISERFEPDRAYIQDLKINEDCIAICLPVVQKETKRKGVLCDILAPRLLTTGMIAHESVHIADYIFDECGALTQMFKYGNEPYAYLVGWVAECFSKAK